MLLFHAWTPVFIYVEYTDHTKGISNDKAGKLAKKAWRFGLSWKHGVFVLKLEDHIKAPLKVILFTELIFLKAAAVL